MDIKFIAVCFALLQNIIVSLKKYIRMISLHLFHNLPITALAHYSHLKIINTTSCWDGMSGSNRSRVLVCFPYTCF